jgi:integrase
MFDARAAKLLAPGEYLTSAEHPGLRLEARGDRRTWTYRYRSPVTGKLRQVKIGLWPEMSVHAAIVAWEQLRARRDAGADIADEKKAARVAAQASKAGSGKKKDKPYTVWDVCDDYVRGHIKVARAKKGAAEVERIFATMLGDFGNLTAAEVTRTQAFDLIQSYASTPIVAKDLRGELGGAWDYALDAGRLPDTTPNWWRLILRGKLKSKGKKIQGEYIGTSKRVLTPREIGELIRWLPNFTGLIDDVLTLYLWTGARGAEIVMMEGCEIINENGQWWWVQPKAKTKNARHERAVDLRIPLFGRALAIALRRKDLYGDSWLFKARLPGGRNEPVQQKTIQSTVYCYQPYSQVRPEKSRLRLPVTHWAPHDLRRTARTRLSALGCPSDVAETIIGHLLPGVEGVYNQYTFDAEKIVWLKRLSDHLEELASEVF